MPLSCIHDHLARFIPSSSRSRKSSLVARSQPSTAMSTPDRSSSPQPRLRKKSSIIHTLKRIVPRKDSFSTEDSIPPIPQFDVDACEFLTSPRGFEQIGPAPEEFGEPLLVNEARTSSLGRVLREKDLQKEDLDVTGSYHQSQDSLHHPRRPQATVNFAAQIDTYLQQSSERCNACSSKSGKYQSLRPQKSSLKLWRSSHKRSPEQPWQEESRFALDSPTVPASPFAFDTVIHSPSPYGDLQLGSHSFPLDALPGVIPPTSSDDLLTTLSSYDDIPHASFSRSSRSSIASWRITHGLESQTNRASTTPRPSNSYLTSAVSDIGSEIDGERAFRPDSPPLGRPAILPYSSTESLDSLGTSLSSYDNEWEAFDSSVANGNLSERTHSTSKISRGFYQTEPMSDIYFNSNVPTGRYSALVEMSKPYQPIFQRDTQSGRSD